jgi:hypothetical protein
MKNFPNEYYYELISVVLTNSALLPMTIIYYKSKEYSYFINGIMVVLTSTLYHICNTTNKFSGGGTRYLFTEGEWHLLDNIFAILGFHFLFTALFTNYNEYKNLKKEKEKAEFIIWFIVLITLICQSIGPWKLINTIIPLVLSVLINFFHFFFFQKESNKIDKKYLIYGIISLFIAFYFFYLGLDDMNDWIRIKHGFWHIFSAISFYFLSFSIHPYK